MLSKEEKKEILFDSGVIGVVRASESEGMLKTVRSLKEGGVKCIEIAMTTPGALSLIEDVSNKFDDVLVGAGTVLDSETAKSAINSGAEYLVSPTIDFDMIEIAQRYGKLVAPGAFTPTEIMKAWQAGADIVKVFPASRLGPTYLSDVKAPLPQVSLMPTGGVTKENADDFVEAGAEVVCVGSALVDEKSIKQGNFEQITKNAQNIVNAVDKGKENR